MSKLPERPSLEQLRKQAKELLQQLRNSESVALKRLHAYEPNASKPILADAQHLIAREYGFESWPKLVHHIQTSQVSDLDQHQRIAEAMVAVYNSADSQAVDHLNDLFHSSLSLEQIRDFIRDKLFNLSDTHRRTANFTLADAQLVVAQLYGFKDWDELVRSNNTPNDLRAAAVVFSSKPPFYRIDWTTNTIEPRQPMSRKDWEDLCCVAKELGITALNSAGLVADDDLEIISRLDQITSLNLDGAKRLTDKGVKCLSRMPQLQELTLGGNLTDDGLTVLRQLSNLRTFHMTWQGNVSDQGITNLRFCHELKQVNLLGSNVGDGLVAALAGKPNLKQFRTGRNVTDEGLKLLHQFPAFKSLQGGEPKYELMSFGAGPTNLLIDGPFTRQGLLSLRGLDGIFGLSFFWHTSRLKGNDLEALEGLDNLGYLGCQGELCNNDAMRNIGALPKLRMLMGQGTVATEEGFRSLSRSQTIEYIWGRECPNLNGAGFTSLAGMSALKGLAVSCKFVDDAALASLPKFPALKELLPMDVGDDGFRYIGRCEQLESLILMYCRDTTDVATSHLVGLSKLKKYYAGYTLITDQSLEMLSGIESLEELSFEGCKFISDEGISFLATLPNLRQVSIGGCPKVTRAALSAFPTSVRVNYDTR